MMRSPNELRTLAMRFFDSFNARDLASLDREVIADDCIQHSPGIAPERTALICDLATTMNAYGDGRFEVDDMIAEGDKVLTRWTFTGLHSGFYGNIPPTGRTFVIKGLDLWRFNAEGKIAEAWFFMDKAGIRRATIQFQRRAQSQPQRVSQ
jgi:steroid delta-isomerase-like uncharacterized protein